MNYSAIATFLIPVLEEITKEALAYDFDTAKGVLIGYLGGNKENLVRIELALAEAKKQKFLSEIK
jgi:hypothetical protein